MPKRDYIDYQDRSQPLAYVITFRSYGTWLHGDDRGSIDRRHYNRYGTPSMPANKKILADEETELKTTPVLLNKPRREVVESAIKEVCEYRKYALHAVNVRTNHVHAVVGSGRKPEFVMNDLKVHATKRLREANLIDWNMKPWARHGSTRYLWTEEQVREAIEYVLFGQGEEPRH